MLTFTLPDLGEGLQDADLLQWLVAEGARVHEDDLVLLVETAKAVVELPAPASCVITKFMAKVGETVQVGQALFDYELVEEEIAVDTDTGKSAQDSSLKSTTEASETQRESVSVVGELAQAKADQTNLFETDPYENSSDKPTYNAEPICINAFKEAKNKPITKKRASSSVPHSEKKNKDCNSARVETSAGEHALPVTLAFAKKLGMEDLLNDTAYGELKMHDLLRIFEEQQKTLSSKALPERSKTDAVTEWHDTITLSGARKVMAQVMTQSHQQIPAATLFDDVDIRHWPEQEDITLRVIQAIVTACKAVPIMNAWYEPESMSLQYHSSVHLGLAVNAKSGLYVPVIRDCQGMSALQLRAQINQFRQQINQRNIAASDMLGASISLSNFGVLCGRYATPMIVPPQVSIVGVGKLRPEPVVKNNQIEVGHVLPVSLSFDHRAVTGGEAAEFMYCLINALSK